MVSIWGTYGTYLQFSHSFVSGNLSLSRVYSGIHPLTVRAAPSSICSYYVVRYTLTESTPEMHSFVQLGAKKEEETSTNFLRFAFPS